MTRMPGFSGEASLTRTNTQYSVVIGRDDSLVVPAFKCDDPRGYFVCVRDNCGLDSSADPDCLRRCREIYC
jgi:hypothetical protein